MLYYYVIAIMLYCYTPGLENMDGATTKELLLQINTSIDLARVTVLAPIKIFQWHLTDRCVPLMRLGSLGSLKLFHPQYITMDVPSKSLNCLVLKVNGK